MINTSLQINEEKISNVQITFCLKYLLKDSGTFVKQIVWIPEIALFEVNKFNFYFSNKFICQAINHEIMWTT